LAPAPLYTSFADCRRAVDVLADLLTTRAYETLPERHEPVT
jgi:kynureninase